MTSACNALDGPVARAARDALERGDPRIAAPWVHAEHRAELERAFQRATRARACGHADAREVADQWFAETAIRLHRATEDEASAEVLAARRLADAALAMEAQARRLYQLASRRVRRELAKP